VNMALSTAQASLKRGILLIFWMIELFVVLVVSLFVEYDTFFVYFWGLSFSFVVLRSPLMKIMFWNFAIVEILKSMKDWNVEVGKNNIPKTKSS